MGAVQMQLRYLAVVIIDDAGEGVLPELVEIIPSRPGAGFRRRSAPIRSARLGAMAGGTAPALPIDRNS